MCLPSYGFMRYRIPCFESICVFYQHLSDLNLIFEYLQAVEIQKMAGLLIQDPDHQGVWLPEMLTTSKYYASILADDASTEETGVDNLYLKRQSYNFLCQQILYKTRPVRHQWTIAGGVLQNYCSLGILFQNSITMIGIFQGYLNGYSNIQYYVRVFLTGALMI